MRPIQCWDTVGALGIPDKIPYFPLDNIIRKRYQFHDTELGKHVERALHAVAIDERRKEFEVTTMNKTEGAPAKQKLIQTWFPGDHGCVGGGSWEKRAFSNRCLIWMVEQAKQLGIDINAQLDLLHDAALADAGAFFSDKINFIYGRRNRKMDASVVSWNDIDNSAKYRWQELPDYRPTELRKRFKTQLDAHTDIGVRTTLAEPTELTKGQTVWARVYAREVSNNSLVLANTGDQFTITVNRLQVWKDADLDPCDILGWNTDKSANAKPAYKDGDKVDPNTLQKTLIRSARNKRVAKHADWFELVVRVGDGEFERLNIKRPVTQEQPFVMTYQAKADGALIFTANDLAHPINVIDKYDNNTGWVWLEITKT